MMTPMKNCITCNALLPHNTDHFYANKSSASGLSNKCKPCYLEYSNAYRARNIDACRARVKAYHDKNYVRKPRPAACTDPDVLEARKEKARRTTREWYAANKDRMALERKLARDLKDALSPKPRKKIPLTPEAYQAKVLHKSYLAARSKWAGKVFDGFKVVAVGRTAIYGKSPCSSRKVIIECNCGALVARSAGTIDRAISRGETPKCRKCFLADKEAIHVEAIARRGNRRPSNDKWSNRVRKLSDYRCFVCGSKEQPVAHHLTAVSMDFSMRNKDSNGVCLCNTCHVDFHDTYGYGGNTPAQFESWIYSL